MPRDLCLTSLNVTSDTDRTLLSVGRLKVPSGSLVGVRGPSGAGKSTLLYALAGILDRLSGEVRWGDADLTAMGAEARAAFRARHVGMIFQDFLLFDELSAARNAALAAGFRPRAERAGLRARAADRLARLGLTDASRPVATFSGGNGSALAIARALAGDADILLADEPTASLHREAADRLIEDLVELARDGGRTLIAVSHDKALLDRMDRILTVEDGMIAADSAVVAA